MGRQFRILAGRIIHQQTTKVVVCVFLIIAFTGCLTHESHSDIIEINIEQNVENVKPLSICDFNGDLKYIPLKGTSVQLKSIILTDFYKDVMLVTDRYNCILCDLQGNIIAKIGGKGKGPGEYSMIIMSMKFGPQGYIYLQETWSLMEFDPQGSFVRNLKPEVIPEKEKGWRGGIMYSWAPFNDSLFIGQVCNDSGQEKIKALFFDKTGKTVRTVPNHIFLNKKQFYTDSGNADATIYILEGKTFIKEHYNDTVFRVNDQFGFEPVYYFNFGKYGLPKAVRELPMQEGTKEKQNYIGMHTFQETLQYLFLYCQFNNHTPARRSEPKSYPNAFGPDVIGWFYPVAMLGIYNKSSKELIFAEPVKSDDRLTNWGLRNDYDGGANFHPRVSVNDSTLAMWVDAWELKQHVSSLAFKNSTPKYPEKKKELERLANSLSDNDNPVLILCAFKK
ncbi:MAG: 6-bladed beta-propeller [Bacteroidia bacterium]|nr:6-bladed beta-propeller [Bacteroidia bacterium]